MTARIGIAAVAVGALAFAGACSLLVSTSDLAGGDAPPMNADANASDATPIDSAIVTEGGLDAGADVADARDPSLVAEFSFEDPAGTIARDTSGNGRDAILFGGAAFADKGVRGRALTLGTTAYASVNSLAAAGFPRSGTLSLWFRHQLPADGENRAIFDDYDNARSHVFVRHALAADVNAFQVALQPMDNIGDYSFICPFTVLPNVWTHVVVSWNEAKSEGGCWVGGALIKISAYLKPFVPTNQVFRLGEQFIGDIDEVRLYSRALSVAEVDLIP
jgi:hypothetical protein